jgi:hypothetical protein
LAEDSDPGTVNQVMNSPIFVKFVDRRALFICQQALDRLSGKHVVDPERASVASTMDDAQYFIWSCIDFDEDSKILRDVPGNSDADRGSGASHNELEDSGIAELQRDIDATEAGIEQLEHQISTILDDVQANVTPCGNEFVAGLETELLNVMEAMGVHVNIFRSCLMNKVSQHNGRRNRSLLPDIVPLYEAPTEAQ